MVTRGMSVLKALVLSFNRISAQRLDTNYERTIVIPVNGDTNQLFSRSLFDDKQLLPGQSRVTHIIFEKSDSRPLTPNYTEQSFHIDYKIHHGFTPNEKMFIRNAMQIIADRLFKSEILQNMYQICGISGQFLGDGVWSRSQLEHDQRYRGPSDLLRFQLVCLKRESETGHFPTIHIYPMYEKNEVDAEGTVGCIACISHGSAFSIKGNFELKLNRYSLDVSNENLKNTVYWAGVIVHEMLHNLGHKHKYDDYSNQWQINVFENCFLSNGNYFL